jgi:hypothetical protein
MKAMIIGLGKNNPSLITAEKIGRRRRVTGVPAKNADKREEIPKVIKTARYMLLFIKFTKPVEISSEKPNVVKEFVRINKIEKKMMSFHSISFLISEKLDFVECIISRIAADMMATSAGLNPMIINEKVAIIMIIVVKKYFLFWITIPGSSTDNRIFLFSSVGFSSFLNINRSIKNIVDINVIKNNIPMLAIYSPKLHPNSAPITKFFKLEIGVNIAPMLIVIVIPIMYVPARIFKTWQVRKINGTNINERVRSSIKATIVPVNKQII